MQLFQRSFTTSNNLTRILTSATAVQNTAYRPWQTRSYITTQNAVTMQRQDRRDRLSEFTKDEDIDTQYVQVKDDAGKLGEPQPLRNLLRTIDRRTHVIVQLTKAGERECAAVQIHDKTELLRTMREREQLVRQQQLAAKDKKPKQLELNWAISDHDLQMKLKQMEQFLEKGKKVEILLAAKKKTRRATPEEAQNVVKAIRKRVDDLGAKEVAPMEGRLLAQALITVKKG